MRSFNLGEGYEVVCESEGTRYGFRHLATVLKDGCEIASAKCCYYNRMWESYEFETVAKKAIQKAFAGVDVAKFTAKLGRV